MKSFITSILLSTGLTAGIQLQAQDNVPQSVATEITAVPTVTIDNTNKVPYNDNFNPAPEFQFNMYPNPVVNEITIVPMGMDIASIEIRDVVGKVQYWKSIEPMPTPQSQIKLNLNDLKPGDYYIRIIARQGALSVKRLRKQ